MRRSDLEACTDTLTLTPGELAIARTVIYASLFDYPLTLAQLHATLLESDLSEAAVLRTYRSSAALPRIVEHRDGFFFQAGRHDLVVERRQREARSRAFLDAHRPLLRLLCAMPFTRMIALSGSVAHLNLESDGDLDLFIVTRGRRVWSVTVAMVVLAKLFKRRRTLCANFVIADSRLALEQQDLFTANQVIHLKPLAGGELYPEFLAANPFVARFYPNAGRIAPFSPPFRTATALDRIKPAIELMLGWASYPVEALCRSAYGWYLRRRSAGWRSPEQVRLQRDALKLHTQSHRQSILDRFDQTVAEALKRADEIEAPDWLGHTASR
jgi:hypothetical protein